MCTKKQLKRKPRLLNQSNGCMFNNAVAELLSQNRIHSEQPGRVMAMLALLMLLLACSGEVWAQSDTSPTQTVSRGNEPYLVTATSGSTYNWTITPGTSGTEWRINGTGNNITVDWNIAGVYTLSVVERNAGGCVGSPREVAVTVNDRPDVIATPSSQTICSSASTNIALSSNTGNATFTWTAALTSGTANGFSEGAGATIAQTLTNTTTSAATVTYTVTPSVNGIMGTPITVVITVSPLPATSPIYHN